MSLPRYPDYKDSGVEWLGHTPSHWTLKRLRVVADLNPSKSEIDGVNRSANVSFLPMEAIGDDGTLDLTRTRPLQEVESGYTYFRDGDVTIAKITPCFENGKGALMQGLKAGIGFGTTELIVARPKLGQITGQYLNWIFRSPTFRNQGEASMYGAGGQKRVPDNFVRNLFWPIPPAEEQAAISTFLDEETTKIHALIAEQEKLVALLLEKRQATISHAVTRGLDSNAPVKDSGMAWLGKVPTHWEVRRLKAISPELTVGIVVEPSKYYVDAGVPALRSLNVSPGKINKENLVYISEESNELLGKSRLRAGDLVCVRTGQPGVTAVVPAEFDGCNCIDLIIIRKPIDNSEIYLSWFFASDAAVQQFSSGSGGAIQQHFNVGMAMNLHIPLPPLIEQRAIVEFLTKEITKLDALQAQAKHAITLLQERRSALIAAAVTGQIDVRNFTVPPTQATEETQEALQ